MKMLFRILGWALAIVAVALVAGWFALRRPDIPFETLEAKYAGEDSQYVELSPGLRVRYVEAGPAEAPVLLLAHGYTASLDTWRPWMKELAGDYRVIALDLPGHGLTRAPDGWQGSPRAYAEVIEQFAAARKLDRFVLVGQSMGGFAAWEYALAHPERLAGLVLVSASGWPDERPEVKARNESALSQALRTEAGRAVLKDLDSSKVMRDGLLAAYGNDALVTDEVVNRYVEMGRAPGHRDITLDMLAGWESWSMATAERLAAIRTPTLILHGEADLLVPVDHARKFDDAIPDSRLIVYQGVGHLPNEEAPARTAADLKAFLGALKLGEAAPAETPPAKPAEAPARLPDVAPTDPSLIFH